MTIRIITRMVMIFVCTMLMTLCFILQESNAASAKSFPFYQDTLTETLTQSIAISDVAQIVTATTVITTNITVTSSVTEEIIVQPYDFSHATYNVETSSSVRPSPIDVKQQLGVWGGGGGGRRDLPNNCLAKHPGIVYYNKPVFVEDLMSLPSRTLQPPSPRSQLDENLPDICVCGFEKDATVNLSLVGPTKDVLLTTQTIAQPISGTNGNFIEGAYCIENNEISTFDFIPGDPLGKYEIVVESNGTTITHSLKLENVSSPYLYYSKRLTGYVLGNFSPNESIRVLLYDLTPEDETWLLSNDVTIQTDENGIALILNENLEAPVSVIRGNPTTDFFEVRMFFNFIAAFAMFNWDELRTLHSAPLSVANLYYHQGRFPDFFEDDPILLLGKAIELRPNFALAYYERGLAYIDDRKNAEAISDFSKAIELRPNFLEAYIARAETYRAEEQYVKALDNYALMIQNNPNPIGYYRRNWFPHSSVYSEILDAIEKANLFGSEIGLLYHLGNILIGLGNHVEAVNIFNKMIALDPNLPDGYYHRAHAQHELGEYVQVVDDLTEVIALDADFDIGYKGWGNIYTLRGLAYNALGQDAQAIADFERALRFTADPIHPMDNMRMHYVPSGVFPMGSLPTDKGAETVEQPQHIVYLGGYWIDKYEVTRQQYAKCVEKGICRLIASNEIDKSSYTDELPVINVTWQDAKIYCEWVGRRLPTEAEWEKAARGKDKRIFPWGSREPEMCNQRYAPNVNYNSDGPRYLYWINIDYACSAPSGAVDMAGNVWEWVADYFDEGYYAVSPYVNPQGPNADGRRVMRGGSWKTKNPNFLRTANRWGEAETYYSDSLGFRCALSDSQAAATINLSNTLPLTTSNNALTDTVTNLLSGFGAIKFCKEPEFNYITGQCTSSGNLISSPVKSVYASWIVPEQYIGSKFKREWYFNGQLFITGEDNNAYAHVEVEARDSLKEGTYTLKLFVENKLIQEDAFQIE
jgi:formylglycine-generating enzyme required for sulfatase activity